MKSDPPKENGELFTESKQRLRISSQKAGL